MNRDAPGKGAKSFLYRMLTGHRPRRRKTIARVLVPDAPIWSPTCYHAPNPAKPLLLPAVTSPAQLNLTIHFSFGDTTLSSCDGQSDSLSRFEAAVFRLPDSIKGAYRPYRFPDRFNLHFAQACPRRSGKAWSAMV